MAIGRIHDLLARNVPRDGVEDGHALPAVLGAAGAGGREHAQVGEELRQTQRAVDATSIVVPIVVRIPT